MRLSDRYQIAYRFCGALGDCYFTLDGVSTGGPALGVTLEHVYVQFSGKDQVSWNMPGQNCQITYLPEGEDNGRVSTEVEFSLSQDNKLIALTLTDGWINGGNAQHGQNRDDVVTYSDSENAPIWMNFNYDMWSSHRYNCSASDNGEWKKLGYSDKCNDRHGCMSWKNSCDIGSGFSSEDSQFHDASPCHT